MNPKRSSAPRPRREASPRRPAAPRNERRRSRRGPLLWIFALGTFLALAGAAGGYYALVRVYANTPNPGSGRAFEVDWPSDLSPSEAASRLEELGLISSAPLFSLYLRATTGTASFVPGPHFLADDLSPRALVRRLERSPARDLRKLMLPEGIHRFSLARRIEEAGICSERGLLEAMTDPELLDELDVDGDSFEGFLFPATYELFADSEPREIVRRLKGELDKRLDRLESRYPEAAKELRESFGWGRKEIVIFASMIEKEAAVDEERPLVASVFLNRLRDKSFLPRQRLQSDATTAYGCISMPENIPSCEGYAGRVTPAMNNDAANPYSTYRHSNLPPGPIANPGERSLEAVFAPAETKYLYFVARGGGRHAFSETLDQHREAIRAAR